MHKQGAIVCSSKQLGQLVVVGNLVAHQPPAVPSTPSAVPLEKLLEAAAAANQAAEATYNDAMLQFEEVKSGHRCTLRFSST